MTEEIKIIQGDSYYADVEICGLSDQQMVEELIFSCEFLGICKELTGSGSQWVIEFTAEQTEGFRVGRGSFDITAVFNGASVNTVIYNNSIEILPKINKCNGN